MHVVDESGGVLPNGGQSVGKVEVRGPWITGSYYRDRVAGKFVDGWLSTGDVGEIDDHGYLTLAERAKDVITSGGEWISSVELNHIMGHPDVVEAAVVPRTIIGKVGKKVIRARYADEAYDIVECTE
jgi:fatty-acyl-CoA synthase